MTDRSPPRSIAKYVRNRLLLLISLTVVLLVVDWFDLVRWLEPLEWSVSADDGRRYAVLFVAALITFGWVGFALVGSVRLYFWWKAYRSDR